MEDSKKDSALLTEEELAAGWTEFERWVEEFVINSDWEAASAEFAELAYWWGAAEMPTTVSC